VVAAVAVDKQVAVSRRYHSREDSSQLKIPEHPSVAAIAAVVEDPF